MFAYLSAHALTLPAFFMNVFSGVPGFGATKRPAVVDNC
jgi:hypothetical protein